MKYEGNNFNKKQKTIKIYLCIHTYILLSVQYAYVKKFKKEIMYVATYIIHTYNICTADSGCALVNTFPSFPQGR